MWLYSYIVYCICIFVFGNQIVLTGDMACFDNQRVLHGRLAYEMEAGGFRHLVGSYIEWDELRSARRVLDNKFGQISH